MINVEVKNMSFKYEEGQSGNILEDITLNVEAGEFVSLLGQSGCGKSTFLRLIGGLEQATSGSICVDGKQVTSPGLDRGIVFQDYGLFPWMTAGKNIMIGLEQKYPKTNKNELKQKAIKCLQDVNLSKDIFNKLPKELSGGMMQRCAIARALGIDPPILLMDEPFGALDAVTRAQLQDLILRLWAATDPKKTVFFVTHDVDEALLLSTRIVVLGQKPSRIIYDCKLPEDRKVTRENFFEDEEIMSLRNELISYMNRDLSRHFMQ